MKSAKEMLGIAKEKTMEQVSMLKTKEGRKAFVAKAKTMAMTTKDKTVTVWRSGIKGKVILCGVTLLVLWLFFPSCDSDSKKADGLTAKSGGSSARLKLKKLRDTDALFYEGSFPQGTSEIEFEDQYNTEGRYKSVAPNVIVLPDTVSLKNLCGSFNPDLEDYRKKGVAYFNDPNGTYYCVVVHVGRGYVVVKPDSTSMYGHCYGYIETDDEYVEGARLKLGFYTYLGTTKKVQLVNGSSHTMYAYQKMDDGIAAELIKAIKYNGKACEAAENENSRRAYAIEEGKTAKMMEEHKAEQEAMRLKEIDACTKIFTSAMSRFEEHVLPRIHVSPGIKNSITVDFPLYGDTESSERESYREIKAKIEKNGVQRYYADKGCVDFDTEFVKKNARILFNYDMQVDFQIKRNNETVPFRLYIYDKADLSNPLRKCTSNEDSLGVNAELYVIGEDDALNTIADTGIANEDGNQQRFKSEFERKYCK